MSQASRLGRPTIMLASTVYNFESEIDQIGGILDAFGYEVWNSHRGTIRTHPGRSNLENCLQAVRDCDLFVGVVRPFYGSGKVGERSITHEEMRLAVSLEKPRWFLVHEHVTLARQLLRPFLYRQDGQPRKRVDFRKTPVLDDLRVLDMYDDIVQTHVPVADRKGHWAQPFRTLSEAMVYLQTQFADIDRVRGIVQEMTP